MQTKEVAFMLEDTIWRVGSWIEEELEKIIKEEKSKTVG